MTNVQEYASKFKALSDEKRINILKSLHEKNSICVCDMCCLFDLTQSKLSYHLKILLEANLIVKEKEGTWNFYKVNYEELNKLVSTEILTEWF